VASLTISEWLWLVEKTESYDGSEADMSLVSSVHSSDDADIDMLPDAADTTALTKAAGH